MSDAGKAPENQDKPKLFGGKYKTAEELEAAYMENEKRASQLQEALDREQRLTELLSEEKKTVVRANFDAPVDDGLETVFPEEDAKKFRGVLENYKSRILNEASQLVVKTVSGLRAQQQAETVFYKRHPDLEVWKDEVDREAALIAREFGERAAKMPQDKLFDEVATRTRKRLADQKTRLSKAKLHVENGEVREPEITEKETEPKVTSETERTQKYFDDEFKRRNKSLGG